MSRFQLIRRLPRIRLRSSVTLKREVRYAAYWSSSIDDLPLSTKAGLADLPSQLNRLSMAPAGEPA
ncbi:hypothetical protein D3C81_2046830 [compost metagenome]